MKVQCFIARGSRSFGALTAAFQDADRNHYGYWSRRGRSDLLMRRYHRTVFHGIVRVRRTCYRRRHIAIHVRSRINSRRHFDVGRRLICVMAIVRLCHQQTKHNINAAVAAKSCGCASFHSPVRPRRRFYSIKDHTVCKCGPLRRPCTRVLLSASSTFCTAPIRTHGNDGAA